MNDLFNSAIVMTCSSPAKASVTQPIGVEPAHRKEGPTCQ